MMQHLTVRSLAACVRLMRANSFQLDSVGGCIAGEVQWHQSRSGVRYGLVVQYGLVVHCGLVWYSVVWCDTVWCSTIVWCSVVAISAQSAVLDETQVYSSYSLASTFGSKLRQTFKYILLCWKKNLAVIIRHEI